jgi:hypothetical protein
MLDIKVTEEETAQSITDGNRCKSRQAPAVNREKISMDSQLLKYDKSE